MLLHTYELNFTPKRSLESIKILEASLQSKYKQLKKYNKKVMYRRRIYKLMYALEHHQDINSLNT